MFLFTNDFLVGNEMIDQDHEYLVSLINKGYDLLHNNYSLDKYDKIKMILSELMDYANEHFAREEAYMESICDPEIIMQRVQHNAFRCKIWEMTFRDIQEDDSQKELLEDLFEYLSLWLYHHILGSDIMIGHLPPLEEWMVQEDPCEFREEYYTGIQIVDSEHAVLFEITGEIIAMLKEGVGTADMDQIAELLGRLNSYTRYHFRDEEEYMEQMQYEGLAAQKRAHSIFINELESIDFNALSQNPQEYLQSLIEFLLGWLINHILKVDRLIPVQ